VRRCPRRSRRSSRACAKKGIDPLEAHAIGQAIAPWESYVSDARFETDAADADHARHASVQREEVAADRRIARDERHGANIERNSTCHGYIIHCCFNCGTRHRDARISFESQRSRTNCPLERCCAVIVSCKKVCNCERPLIHRARNGHSTRAISESTAILDSEIGRGALDDNHFICSKITRSPTRSSAG